jgi:hypothetical protein
MPLPEKVIEQLGREPAKTPGWALGALFFSGGILFLAVVIYVGLAFGYEPYLQSQLASTQNEVSALGNKISPSDQTQLINFYSQLSNLQALLKNHILTSQFFTWLESNTEANVYYQSFSLTQGNRVSMTGEAVSEADVSQQIAIFENSTEVSSVSISNVTAPLLPGGMWTFNMILTMDPSLFLASTQ